MGQNKNQIPAGAVWEVDLHAPRTDAEQVVLASFFVRLAADMPLPAESAQDEVHRYLLRYPDAYRGGEAGPKTLLELFDIPIEYVLDQPVEHPLPEHMIEGTGSHQPVELRELHTINLREAS